MSEDTAGLGKRLLAETNLYRALGDRFTELFPEEQVFAALCAQTGRGAMPPLLMALVTVFQFLEKVPDRSVAERVLSRIDWKYALRLPLGYAGFHFTDWYALQVRDQLLAVSQDGYWFMAQVEVSAPAAV